MKSDVVSLPGPWEDDATTLVDARGPRAARHRNLLRALLMFYSLDVEWTDERRRAQWKLLTGKKDVSTRALCEAIRESGLSLDQLL